MNKSETYWLFVVMFIVGLVGVGFGFLIGSAFETDVVMFDDVSCEFDDYFLVESYVMRDNVFYADLEKVIPLESVGGGLFVRVEN